MFIGKSRKVLISFDASLVKSEENEIPSSAMMYCYILEVSPCTQWQSSQT